MSNKVKLYNQKNRTYCLFNGTINIKIFDPNRIKIDEKSHKDIHIYTTWDKYQSNI